MSGAPGAGPHANAPTGDAFEQAKANIANLLTGASVTADSTLDVDVAAAEHAAGTGKPKAHESSTQQDDKQSSAREPRIVRIRVPSRFFAGADVVNGALQLTDEMQSEIARRYHIARARQASKEAARRASRPPKSEDQRQRRIG